MIFFLGFLKNLQIYQFPVYLLAILFICNCIYLYVMVSITNQMTGFYIKWLVFIWNETLGLNRLTHEYNTELSISV